MSTPAVGICTFVQILFIFVAQESYFLHSLNGKELQPGGRGVVKLRCIPNREPVKTELKLSTENTTRRF